MIDTEYIVFHLWGIPLLSFITAGAGAYLGSYLKKKGENLATKEDIGELTRRTREIESKIDDQVWNRQRQWEVKRDILLDVTRRLADAHDSIAGWATFVSLSDESGKERWKDDRQKALDKWRVAHDELVKSVALVSIVCNEETVNTLDAMIPRLNEIFRKVVERSADVSAKFQDLKESMATARKVIRFELSSPIVPTSQSTPGSSATLR